MKRTTKILIALIVAVLLLQIAGIMYESRSYVPYKEVLVKGGDSVAVVNVAFCDTLSFDLNNSDDYYRTSYNKCCLVVEQCDDSVEPQLIVPANFVKYLVVENRHNTLSLKLIGRLKGEDSVIQKMHYVFDKPIILRTPDLPEYIVDSRRETFRVVNGKADNLTVKSNDAVQLSNCSIGRLRLENTDIKLIDSTRVDTIKVSADHGSSLYCTADSTSMISTILLPAKSDGKNTLNLSSSSPVTIEYEPTGQLELNY